MAPAKAINNPSGTVGNSAQRKKKKNLVPSLEAWKSISQKETQL